SVEEAEARRLDLHSLQDRGGQLTLGRFRRPNHSGMNRRVRVVSDTREHAPPPSPPLRKREFIGR
ncbi:hypothetical protein FA95DRAFT_1560524, partial [Auriscalpium vulgare]